MILLSEEEQKQFLVQCQTKALQGKTGSDNPSFVFLMGAKGSGKTTLARKLPNTVLASADDIICDYFKATGADPRVYEYDDEERAFFTKALNGVFMAAIKNKCNIAYDTGLTDNSEKLMLRMQKFGYNVEIKAMLIAPIEAQLNVIDRKLKFDNNFTDYKSGKTGYPDGQNPTRVDAALAKKSAITAEHFLAELDMAGESFEVWEYGSDEVKYSTKSAQIPFVDYLDDFHNRQPEVNAYKPRINELDHEASRQGNTKISADLARLRGHLFDAKPLKRTRERNYER